MTMTNEEAIKELIEEWEIFIDGCGLRGIEEKEAKHNSEFKKIYEAHKMAIQALEQLSGDAVSRQAVLDYINRILNQGMGKKKSFEFIHKFVEKLPSVNPQPKTGCEGCTYEKTGNNSTYPCSHCGRCYTDKYKAES